MRRSLWGTVTIVLAAAAAMAITAPAASAAKKAPDTCTLVTQADVSTAFAKLEPALQPTSVAAPEHGKPASQGGFGTASCSTAFYLPNSVGGSVLVNATPVSSKLPCFPKGQPGKTVKIAGTKALLEPVPSDAKTTRNVTFVDKGSCVSIEVFVSGGDNHVPASGFTDLAAAALSK